MSRVEILQKKLNDNEGFYISSYANIYYFSGFTSEDARLIITPNDCILMTDSRYTVQAKNQAKGFDIRNIADKSIIERLGIKRLGIEEENLTVKELGNINKGDMKVFPAGNIISEQREIKDSEEIGKIRAAEKLGDEAFSHVLNFISPGIRELDVAFELEVFMRKNGASGLSFDTIAASGIRSAMPHGMASEKIIEKGDLLTLDFGCVLDGYCSDMTRTVAVDSIDSKSREIYETVLAAQKAGLEYIAKGKICSGADAAARKVITEAGYGKNFGHALGHSVGIEIHESPTLSPKCDKVLVPGNVVTVEPGIYVENFGGVRIEDLVLVTDSGIENFTHSEKELIIV